MLKKFQTAFRLQKSFLRHLCRLAGLGGDHQKRLILLETKLLKWHVKWNCWKLWTWKIRTEMGYHMVPWCKNMEYLTWRICWSVTQERKVAQCMAQCMAQGRSKRTRAGSHRPGSLPARVSLQCPPRALVCPNPCTTITDQKQKAASLKFNFLQWRNTKTSNFPESSLQIDKAVNIAIRAKKENVKEVMSAYHVALCCCLRIYTCLGPCAEPISEPSWDTYPTTQHWIQVETPTGTGLRWWNNVVRRWLELLGYQESFCEDVMNNNYLLEKPKTEEPLVLRAMATR